MLLATVASFWWWCVVMVCPSASSAPEVESPLLPMLQRALDSLPARFESLRAPLVAELRRVFSSSPSAHHPPPQHSSSSGSVASSLFAAGAPFPSCLQQLNDTTVGGSTSGASVVPQRIPRILHQSWHDELLPNHPLDLAAFRRNCIAMNPDWIFLLWTDEDIHEFVRMVDPGLFVHAWQLFEADIQRWDAARYLWMATFGGVYMDVDYECLQPFDGFVTHVERAADMGAVAWDQDFSIHLLASVPGQKFWWELLANIPQALSSAQQLRGPLYAHKVVMRSTGAQFFTAVAHQNSTRRLCRLTSDLFNPCSFCQRWCHCSSCVLVHRYAMTWNTWASRLNNVFMCHSRQLALGIAVLALVFLLLSRHTLRRLFSGSCVSINRS